MKKKKRRVSAKTRAIRLHRLKRLSYALLFSGLVFFLFTGFGLYYFSYIPWLHSKGLFFEPNRFIKPFVETYLKANDADRLVSIIECESNFAHFETDGSPLKNRAGSSAIGITQILSSVHPDPQAISTYNRRNDTDYTVDDFKIETLRGNLDYALLLYDIRGVRDWECSKFGY